MHQSIITILGTLLFIGGIASILFRILGISTTPAYLFAGMLFATFQNQLPLEWQIGVDVVQPYMELGLMLLMFGAGLDLSSGKIRKLGRSTLALGLIQSLSTALIAMIAWTLFNGLDRSAVVIGLALAFSSTGSILQYLDDRQLLRQSFAKNVIGILLLEDLLAIFAIIALPALAGEQNKVPIVAVAWQLLLISSVLWLAGGFIGPRLTWLGLRRGGVQLLLVLSLGLCLMTGMLFSKANLSPAFGAFIVGMLLAETTEITKIRLLVTPIKHLFMAVFFVAFGMQFQASQITSGFLPAIILIPCLILGKFIIPFGVGLWHRKSLSESFFTALILPQVGEFSIIIASSAVYSGIIPQESLSSIMVLSLVSLTVVPWFLNHKDHLYSRLEKSPLGEFSHKLQRESERLRSFSAQKFAGKKLSFDRLQILFSYLSEIYLKTRALSKTSQLAKITPWNEHLSEVIVEAGSPSVGLTVMELGLRQNFAINLVAIERDGEVYVSPEPNFRILPWDVLILYGTDEQVNAAESIFHRCEKRRTGSGTKLSDCVLRELTIYAGHPFSNATMKELDLRSAHGMMVLAVMRNDQRERNPNPDYRFAVGDVIFYVATRANHA